MRTSTGSGRASWLEMSFMDNTPVLLPRLLYRLAEVQSLLGVSRPTIFRLLRAGRLEGKKIGSRTVVTAKSIERFIDGLPSAGRSA
jgi:excisionase family DNA binding protein